MSDKIKVVSTVIAVIYIACGILWAVFASLAWLAALLASCFATAFLPVVAVIIAVVLLVLSRNIGYVLGAFFGLMLLWLYSFIGDLICSAIAWLFALPFWWPWGICVGLPIALLVAWAIANAKYSYYSVVTYKENDHEIIEAEFKVVE
jgi:MFS family permease